jgi:high-affinity Fe2+/Pb2+ permease
MNEEKRVPTEGLLMLMAGALLAILGGMWLQFLFIVLEFSKVNAVIGLTVATIALVMIFYRTFREIQPP